MYTSFVSLPTKEELFNVFKVIFKLILLTRPHLIICLVYVINIHNGRIFNIYYS